MKNNVVTGSILVALGASSYGVLATFVKLAYRDGFTTEQVTVSQFVIGAVVLAILLLVTRPKHRQATTGTGRDIFKLMLGGTSVGLTSIFFYSAVKLIPVGLGIVLLMQSIWMGVVLELVLNRKYPGIKKIVATCMVLIGTVLAVDFFGETGNLNTEGFLYGILSAIAYTLCLYASNNLGLSMSSTERSLFLVLGGLLTVVIFSFPQLIDGFAWSIFYTWGPVVALFGTVFPPLLFTRGMPLTGIGLGAIIAAIELPVSIIFAFFLLGEKATFIQWAGVLLIIAAVFIMNYSGYKPIEKNTGEL